MRRVIARVVVYLASRIRAARSDSRATRTGRRPPSPSSPAAPPPSASGSASASDSRSTAYLTRETHTRGRRAAAHAVLLVGFSFCRTRVLSRAA